jgi:TM2 domain-containing membrane protein YozV
VEWYYIGHYGQLGPLTKEQMDELIEGSVIVRDTYVWRSGMAQWQLAEAVAEFRTALQDATPFAAPPPPPMSPEPPRQVAPQAKPAPFNPAPTYYQPAQPTYPVSASYFRTDLTYATRSDRSRVWAGVLQLIFPGVGRMYLGYYAYGTLQLILTICTGGIMHLWSMIDGIMILAGGVKFDGFGRALQE